MIRIYEQKRVVTSPFDEKMFINGIESELGSAIFKELINEEKKGIMITVNIDVLEDKDEVYNETKKSR